MGPHRHLRLTSAALVLAAAAAACGRSADGDVGVTHTTSAVLRPEVTAGASCPPSNPEAPLASSAGGTAPESSELSAPSEETRVAPAAAPPEPAYERAPLYDPNGGTVSDVGEPYPLPAVPPAASIDRRPGYARPATSVKPGESSFFPESSFGPNARP